MTGHPTPGTAGAAHCPPTAPGANPAGPLPQYGEQIDAAVELLSQAIAILRQPVDPASTPAVQAWPSLSPDILVHDVLISEAIVNVQYALREVAKAGALPVGPIVDVAPPRPPLGVIGPACGQGLPTGPCDLLAGHDSDHRARP